MLGGQRQTPSGRPTVNQQMQTIVKQALDAARHGYGAGVDASRFAAELQQHGFRFDGGGEGASVEEALDRAGRGYGAGWDITRLAGALLETGWCYTRA